MFTHFWARPKLLRSIRRKTRLCPFASPWSRLHAEPLEDRRLMSVDYATTVVDVKQAEVADEISSRDPSPAASALPERFRSAAEFESWLADAAVAQWGHLFGQTTFYPQWDWGRFYTTDAVFLGGPLVPATMAGPTNTFSETNVQVEGVDEADLVETDGEYLYILSGQDLVIVQAGIGDELEVVSRTRLNQRPLGMYLSGDRLALVSSTPADHGLVRPIDPIPVIVFNDGANREESDETEPAGPTTTVAVLDVRNRSAPSLVHTTEMDGQLVTSRVVDGQLRLVVTNSLQLPRPIAHPVATVPEPETPVQPSLPSDPNVIRILPAVDGFWQGPPGPPQVYETKTEYLTRLRGELIETVMPQLRNLSLDGDVTSTVKLFEPTDLYRPDSFYEQSVITVATFDLASDEAGTIATANVMSAHAPQV
jgi:hypothetical protein